MNIVTLDEIDPDVIDYSEPIINDDINQLYVSYDDGPFIVKLPPMLFLNGIINTHHKRFPHTIYLKLKGEKEIEFFNGLDEKMVEDGRENKEYWPFIGKEIEYKKLVQDIDGDTIKLKFINNGNISTKVFNMSGDLVSKNDYDIYFQGPCYIRAIIEIVSVWFKEGIYGLHIKLHQLELDV